MTQHFTTLVPGASPGRTFSVTAPFDETVIATVDDADIGTVEQALASAWALFRNRRTWLSAELRMSVFERAAAIMQQRAEELALEAAREGGKPLADSRIEVARAIDGVKNCIEIMRTQAGTEIPMQLNQASTGHLAFTRHEPIGVVVAVSAFNHPLNLAVHQVAPAIAAGCPVIIKPAHDTPLSCFRFVSILREAGLPDDWCQALATTDNQVAEQLVTDQRVGFFSFIGSGRVGWMLRSKLAPGTRCALEHGGAAPVIVAADADLEDAIPIMARAGLYHAGQVCVSVQRVYAHVSIATEVAEGLAAQANKMRVGDPTREDTDIGPLIRPAEVDRVEQWVQEAGQAGARILCGGRRLSDTCFAPTVILGAPDDSLLNCQEVFGPVISVNTYTDLDDAIQRANDLPYAFQAAVFTRDIDTALAATSQLDASAVMVNQSTAFRVDWMPFAGLRQSGLGVGGIPHTFEDMQISKMTVIRSKSL